MDNCLVGQSGNLPAKTIVFAISKMHAKRLWEAFERLPDGKKVYFKVFDFWDNFEYWDMHPEGDQKESGEAITNRIFLVRLRQLEHCLNAGDVEKAEDIKKKLFEDIASLPKDSVSVRESLKDVEKALSLILWDNVGLDPVEFLKKKITPLMRFRQDVNLNEATFTLKCEKLGVAILRGDREEIERLKPR